MNPAEEIVKFWLQNTGYFFQSSIRVEKEQGREIDILAIDGEGRNKRHIEVSVSVKMADYTSNPKTKAEKYSNKFNHPTIKREVKNRFGNNSIYKKELVVGDVSMKKKDALEKFINECKRHKIKVIKISEILSKITPELKEHNHLNPIIRAVQISSKFMNL